MVISTIGDHIRTRRLDLGLFQKDVAERIGVTTDTITNWELNRTEPELRCYPGIIEFLGYVPLSSGESFPERLKAYRMLIESSQRKFAKLIGVGETTVRYWETGKGQSRQELRKRVEQLIDRASLTNNTAAYRETSLVSQKRKRAQSLDLLRDKRLDHLSP